MARYIIVTETIDPILTGRYFAEIGPNVSDSEALHAILCEIYVSNAYGVTFTESKPRHSAKSSLWRLGTVEFHGHGQVSLNRAGTSAACA